jgi:zinc-ribbon domain
MARFCPNCGTEIDESALFCPSCGQPIEALPDEPAAEPGEPAVARTAPTARTEAHPGTSEAGTGPWVPPGATPPPEPSPFSQINVPVTMPTTLSGWLIGGGAALGALGALIGLFGGIVNPIEFILLVVLLGIAATVFFSESVPTIPHLRLATLAVVLVAFGVALDRIGFGVAGLGELFLFLGSGAASIGALVLELGYDQPIGGSGTPA